MTTFDAVMIEHTLARFFGKRLGQRGEFYDADYFRAGNPKHLGTVLERVAERLEKRVAAIKFESTEAGSAKAQIEGAITRLRALAPRVKQRSGDEREDYHWEVFGALIMTVNGLLERLEEQT
jgi:hypothetical protein